MNNGLSCNELCLLGVRNKSSPASYDDEMAFYDACSEWICGEDNETIINKLTKINYPSKERIIKLLQKKVINVATLLPWHSDTQHALADGIKYDSIFNIVNLVNETDGLQKLHKEFQPDFAICEMLEWHDIPKHFFNYKCLKFAQIADIDYSFHYIKNAVAGFNYICATDMSEKENIASLITKPIIYVPNPFAASKNIESVKVTQKRKYDLVLSGTAFELWHRDKAELYYKILNMRNLKVAVINGHVPQIEYFNLINQSKVVFCYYRNLGGALTRAIDAATVGSVPLLPEGNITSLNNSLEKYGATYSIKGSLEPQIYRAIKKANSLDRTMLAQKARIDFDRRKISSKYFRSLAIQSTLLENKKNRTAYCIENQKSLRIFIKGWGSPSIEKENYVSDAIEMHLKKQKRVNTNYLLNFKIIKALHCITTYGHNHPPIIIFNQNAKIESECAAIKKLIENRYHDNLDITYFVNLLRGSTVISDLQLTNCLLQRFLLIERKEAWIFDPETEWLQLDINEWYFDQRKIINLLSYIKTAQVRSIDHQVIQIFKSACFHIFGIQLNNIEYLRKAYSLNTNYSPIIYDLALAEFKIKNIKSFGKLARLIIKGTPLSFLISSFILLNKDKLNNKQLVVQAKKNIKILDYLSGVVPDTFLRSNNLSLKHQIIKYNKYNLLDNFYNPIEGLDQIIPTLQNFLLAVLCNRKNRTLLFCSSDKVYLNHKVIEAIKDFNEPECIINNRSEKIFVIPASYQLNFDKIKAYIGTITKILSVKSLFDNNAENKQKACA